MVTDVIWVWFYRFCCIKITIDAIFYYAITLHFLASIDCVIKLVLWLAITIFITPFELFMLILMIIMQTFDICQDTYDEWITLLKTNNKTKLAAKKEYELYKQILFGDKE